MAGYQPIKSVDEDIEMVSTSKSMFSGGATQTTTKASNASRFVAGAVVSFCMLVIFIMMAGSTQTASPVIQMQLTSSMFDESGRYVMRDYDTKKPMSNFLNGLGGIWGIPMWAFYVNRGQGICSFGKQNKDNGIMKFDSAEKAYQTAPFSGFRTFVKGKSGGKSFTHMPFFPTTGSDEISRDMMIGQNELEIQETNPSIDLKTNVLYFTTTNEEFPSLVRSTTFTNMGTSEMSLEVLDGLGRLIPSGLSNSALEAMGRTMEAWMNVYNVDSEDGRITEPFFHISQDPADTAQVKIVHDGHFAVSFIEDEGEVDAYGLYPTLPFVVDPSLVYGVDTTLTQPSEFFSATMSLEELVEQKQGTVSKTPSCFAGASLTIPAGKSVTITSVYGHAQNLNEFLTVMSPKVRVPGYASVMRSNGDELVKAITKKVETKTASPVFDKYIAQDYLDNVLRGGIPLAIGDKVFHTFSRIHGDIERDYNYFSIETTYYSQGPGNFRDVCQNRRLDVLHTPIVKDFNVRMFLSFVQADAYNPLTVASTNFMVPPKKLKVLLSELDLKSGEKELAEILSASFRPGQLFEDMKNKGVTISGDKQAFLDKVVTAADQSAAAQYNQNAFWADHWTYTLDLIDNFVAVYPDEEEEMLWDSEPIPFYMSPASVKPRSERYTLVDNPSHPGQGMSTIRVYAALAVYGQPEFSSQRRDALDGIHSDPATIVDSTGAGGIWQRSKDGSAYGVSAISKLLLLGILKFSTLDPMGMGVEMEGGKPGWNDAMNGLPGIIGSGMPETYEMLKVLKYIKSALEKFDRSIVVPGELGVMVKSLEAALEVFESSPKDKQANFVYWDASNNAREAYRASTNRVFSGVTTELSSTYLIELIDKMETKTYTAIDAAVKGNNGLSPTYFYYECTSFEMSDPLTVQDPPLPSTITALEFKQHSLPLFLEGPTRHLKVVKSTEERKKIYAHTKKSGLYDAALEMYTISESLVGMSPDIGRMMAFAPGWLENQSVWLHMSYKYYLELLRGGLYEEFFAEIKTGLVPFMDNDVYGRSPLEAASFIASTAFPDAKLHGASFLARLSGSTAEMLSIWSIMMMGPNPFSLDKAGELQLKFSPVLPEWLFTEEGLASFTFLGFTDVTYVNPEGVDSWLLEPKYATVVDNEGTTVTVEGAVLGKTLAEKVRRLEVKSITVQY